MTTKQNSPQEKALFTAKWARAMTKWLVTYNSRTGAKWNVVAFVGRKKAESAGIVDMIAIRKNHRQTGHGLKRGDLLEIILIQTKGGSASRPSADDVGRMKMVAKHHKAKSIILAEWQRGKKLELSRLRGMTWEQVSADEIFG